AWFNRHFPGAAWSVRHFVGVTPSVRHFLGDYPCFRDPRVGLFKDICLNVEDGRILPRWTNVEGHEQLPSTTCQVQASVPVVKLAAHCNASAYAPTPVGWSICRGCRLVFIKDGQRFCGLCQWRTPAGANYQRIIHQRIRDMMNQAEQIRNMFVPGVGEPIPPPPVQLAANEGLNNNEQDLGNLQGPADPFDEEIEQMMLE
ncbi:unnamed protein product, partial [Allacma fusca]